MDFQRRQNRRRIGWQCCELLDYLLFTLEEEFCPDGDHRGNGRGEPPMSGKCSLISGAAPGFHLALALENLKVESDVEIDRHLVG
jgi:hypothetical protein